jgi:hypothetical protein
MVLLFYRRERLEYDERYDEFGLLTFDTRSKYEKKIQGLENLVRPIIIELQISSFGDIINEQRQTNYGSKLETVKAKLEEFDKVNPSLTDIFLVRQRKELEEQIEELETEIDKPFTLIEAISIDSPYLDPIKFHTNTLGDIPDLLIKDNELRLQQEKELEESMKSLQAPSAKKETTMEKLMRKQKESTTARKKAQAEAEAKAKSEEEAKVRAQSQAITQAQAIPKAQAITQAIAKTQTQTQTQTIAEAQEKAEVQEQERISQEAEEISKIQEIRKEAEEAMNQLREIPLEERIRRKIFVQPEMVHNPYPFVRSSPANPPYDTTKYEKRQNLFKNSEISSIFPRPII